MVMRDFHPDHINPSSVVVASSDALDPAQAVRETVADIDPAGTCFVLALVPNRMELDPLARALTDRLDGVPVFGCTTAGQITSAGYESDALLLMAFRKENFRCSSVLIEPLKPLAIAPIVEQVGRTNTQFPRTAGWSRLALVFADGVAKQEDLLASVLETVLEDVPVFGGSAGDGLNFGQTFVLHNGRFQSNAALVLLIETNMSFLGLSFDHFAPSGTQLVVTSANPEERIVYEINGAPAAQEYARLVGCSVADLSSQVFAENPLLVCHKMQHYVRAISHATEDHALSFMAAIDDGLIMMLGRGKEILHTLEAELDVAGRLGAPADFVLGFDCVLRKLEAEEKQLGREVSDIFRKNRVFGFNTYGEQHCGLHMNHTFVGVAFFENEEKRLF